MQDYTDIEALAKCIKAGINPRYLKASTFTLDGNNNPNSGVVGMAKKLEAGDCGLVIDRDENAAINIETFAVSSTGRKKSAAKKPLTKSSDGVKVSREQKINGKSTC